MKLSRELLHEDIIKLFFDFYVLNYLWFKTSGLVQYGYQNNTILHANKERRINDFFFSKVALLKSLIIEGLEDSVRNEMRHLKYEFYDEKYHLDCDDDYEGDLDTRIIFIRKKYGRCSYDWPLEIISDVYGWKGWSSAYGGKKWKIATDALIALKKSNNIKDDIFWIDQIFDLQHNTGFILNKTMFSSLEEKILCVRADGKKCKRKILNYRFTASPEDMSAHASIYTRKLLIANKNFLNGR